jgi:hypothetical protein
MANSISSSGREDGAAAGETDMRGAIMSQQWWVAFGAGRSLTGCFSEWVVRE